MNDHFPPVPAHVDRSRIIDYNVYADPSYDAIGNVHEAMWQLARQWGFGVFWTPHNGGHWVVNDNALLVEAVRDGRRFSSRLLSLPPMPEGQEPRFLPVHLDGDEHRAYREPLSRAFSPSRVRAMQASMRSFAQQLIEAVADKGGCDFVSAIAEPFPVIVFMEFMGLETSRLREFRTWAFDMMCGDADRRLASHKLIMAMLDELIAARRDDPRDDLLSALIATEVFGKPLSDEDLVSYSLQLFAAGLDSVANSLIFMMKHLASDPELQKRLRAEPERITDAIEEMLRVYGVAIATRVVAEDTELGGARMKAGDRLLLHLIQANYDGKAFPDPMSFDIDRSNKTHISFNAGPHRCVGSNFARMEMHILFEEWLRLIPEVELVPDQRPVIRTGVTFGLETLNIRWDPSKVRSANAEAAGQA